MPHQEPSGPQGPSVRRAVPLSGSAHRPDPASLLPKGRKGGARATPEEPVAAPAPVSGTTGADPDNARPEPPKNPDPVVARTTTVPLGGEPLAPEAVAAQMNTQGEEAGSPVAGSPTPETASGRGGSASGQGEAAGKSEAATGTDAAATGTDEAATGTDAAKNAAPQAAGLAAAAGHGGSGAGGAEAVSATATGLPPQGGTATDTQGDEPPSGRPTKALLAAAAIGGVLLIAVPLLAFAANDDDKKDKTAPTAAGVTIPDKEEAKGPALYSAKSPSPSPSPSKKDAHKDDKGKTGEKTGALAPVAGAPTASAESGKSGKPEEPEKAAEKETKKEKEAPAKKTLVASGASYKVIRNVKTGMCADLPGFGKGKVGGPVNEYYCDATSKDNQLWSMDVKINGGGPNGSNLFVIRNAKDGLCMDVPGKGVAPGGSSGVIEGVCDGSTGDNQLFWLESRGSGTYWIHNFRSNNQCLEIWGSAGGGGWADSRLDLTGCSPNDDHEWRLG